MIAPLTIGALPHTVELVESGFFEDENSLGECDYVLQEIKLLEVLTPERKRQILMHEIGEAITGTHLLNIDHMALSVLMVEMLRVLDDNAHLRKYLWEA